jgi:predicted DNA-binding protein (MmcQ/YjbR family)
MDIDWVREYCLALSHTTEKVQWGDDLVFKIGEKMYAVVALEPGDHWLAFKCSPEEFSALVERPGIVPAPYLARAQWVALETYGALPTDEIKRLLSQAYSLIFRKLSKRLQARLTTVNRSKTTRHRRKTARNLQRLGKSSRSAASRKRK